MEHSSHYKHNPTGAHVGPYGWHAEGLNIKNRTIMATILIVIISSSIHLFLLLSQLPAALLVVFIIHYFILIIVAISSSVYFSIMFVDVIIRIGSIELIFIFIKFIALLKSRIKFIAMNLIPNLMQQHN